MRSQKAEVLDRGLLLIRQGIEVVRRHGHKELGGEELTSVLRRAFEESNRLEAVCTALIGELDSLERERPDGERERSVPGWLEREVHLTDRAAYARSDGRT